MRNRPPKTTKWEKIKMTIVDVLKLTDEEKQKFPLARCLADALSEIDTLKDFLDRDEYLSEVEDFLVSICSSNTETFIKMIMLGEIPFPLPNAVRGWTDEQLEKVHKRYRNIKKMNRLSKSN